MNRDNDRVTPEEQHNRLMAAIAYEIDTHGPASLAEVIGTMLERHDEEDTSDDAQRTRKWSEAFHDLAYSALPEPAPGLFARTQPEHPPGSVV